MKLLIDTNIINKITDGELDPAAFHAHELYITDIQDKELRLNKSHDRTHSLLQNLKILGATQKPSTGVWDDSGWDKTALGNSDGLLEKIEQRIKVLDVEAGKKSKQEYNQSRDARIAEAAIRYGMTLVTDDGTLRKAAAEYGCNILTPAELISK